MRTTRTSAVVCALFAGAAIASGAACSAGDRPAGAGDTPAPPPSSLDASRDPSAPADAARERAPDASPVDGDGAAIPPAADGGSYRPELCVERAPQGTQVTPVKIAAAAPAAKGGTIAAGRYALTAIEEYVGVGGTTDAGAATFWEKCQLDATDATLSLACTDADNDFHYLGWSYERADTNLNLVYVCPATLIKTSWTFTATPTELILIGLPREHGADGPNVREVYTRQP